jgi:hypothetical protein
VPIIRRNNCVCATLGTCYSLWMTAWYAGCNQTSPCIPDSHPQRITSTKVRITFVSPDDGHIVARNMWGLINILGINILRINRAPKLVLFARLYRDARSTKHKKDAEKLISSLRLKLLV